MLARDCGFVAKAFKCDAEKFRFDFQSDKWQTRNGFAASSLYAVDAFICQPAATLLFAGCSGQLSGEDDNSACIA
jgi:hypothetical protein